MIKALRGMNDILNEKAQIYKHIVEICESVALNFGYSFIETPKLENTSLFKRSVGESSDIVGKEMYEFTDKGGNDVCLRPEGTAGVVRAFIEHKFDKTSGVKRYFYHGSMFRYERPQKGRLREFHQFGIECFGENSIYEDASVIIIGAKILQKLGIKTTLKINSLGDKNCMPEYKNKLVTFLNNIQDELCEDCKRRIQTNPIRVLDCKVDHCKEVLKNAPLIINNLSKECESEFKKLQEILTKNGIKFEIDPKLVRGLDYYTKTAFEFVSDEIGSQSAVLGGGRYDNLVEFLGGKPTYGVGFALGIERIMEILSSKDYKIQRKKIYLCALDDKFIDQIYNLCLNLRDEYEVEISYEAKNATKHLKNADNINANVFLCVGEDEAKNSEIWYKNLQNKQDKKIKISDIKQELKANL
ncbi:histidyl-tRNA synthetase [Campylobacter sputorum subsp. bubulus]|uniref:Histidine--tRNA ligase n=1 Tax=Campylobacter sputorum subsp. sputorum TaxID=32024 RepID=A0A381DHU7_9BACT|nr:histidine--tRNA ligase [Campylobacter sputorum]ASM35319.1 histidyl-tRNA synthetase [Campylobacter sputorum aubsp. sputorum RM3237]KAB0582936.1 histidine--tRNA ligase [Campylobacter sputorum subsp. sputorum]QEL05511.1 histidyl-tRNA synthetase [Campylobacter sputorum subsp. sputorum]SUX08670.1 histidyl-tRNA synthetase [Campylobacter sputorum subsp. bubulus]SUX10274.1 histidyl-tRNA synthetase [Campylobacter sputorum subsp. sputorum]